MQLQFIAFTVFAQKVQMEHESPCFFSHCFCIWRWLFHPSFVGKKIWFFRPPEASNSPMTKPFELGGLQIIVSEPPMSNSSGVTHMVHASRRKFSFLKKICKKLSYFLKPKISVIQAKSLCVQKNFKKSGIF